MRTTILSLATAASLAALVSASRDARAQPASKDTVDCAGAFNDAGALRDQHKLIAARARYQICTQPACPSFVGPCKAMAAEVGAAIPSVSLRATDPGGAAVPDVVVTMDGERVPAGTGGASVEVDPGPHKFHFEAKGFGALTLDLVILDGKKDQPVAITLTPVAPTPAPAPVPSAAPAPAPVPAPATSPATSPALAAGASTSDAGGLGTQRTIALIAGGVGLVSLGVGLVFAVDAGSHWSTAKQECQPGACAAGSPAQNDYNSAQNAASLSTAFVVAGGIAAAGGALLWLLAPSRTSGEPALRVAPTATAGGAGLSIGGAF